MQVVILDGPAADVSPLELQWQSEFSRPYIQLMAYKATKAGVYTYTVLYTNPYGGLEQLNMGNAM